MTIIDFDTRGVIGFSDEKYHSFLLNETGKPFHVRVATFRQLAQV
jgi:hypothetical protein